MRYQLPDGRVVGADAPVTIKIDEQTLQCAYGWLRYAAESELQSAGITPVPDEAPLYWDERYEQNIGGQIVPLDPAIIKNNLRGWAALVRYRKETGGITVGGAEIKTDRESQSLISGAYAMAQYDPQINLKFKTATGFVTLDAATITAIAVAVGQHVQACFALEAQAVTDIVSGDITTFEEIDALFA